MKQVTIPIRGNYQKSEPPVKRLSDAEFRTSLDKGLCFKCNERYSPGHRCKMEEKRELMLFIMNEEESLEEESRIEESNEDVLELKQIKLEEATEIELKAIHGLTNKGTMKLKGEIKGREVRVLIDSEVTHNFIHNKIVEEMGLALEKSTPFEVTIGDGTRCQGRGMCKRLELKLKEIPIVVDFLAIELGNVHLILGMQWLDTTGTMKIHRPSLTMTFWMGKNRLP